jgi:hypothetical protein
VDRILITDKYGRHKIHRTNKRSTLGFIKLRYASRALEWLNICKLFQDLLSFFHFSHLCSIVDDITFAWSYTDNLSTVFYKPSAIFKKFSFIDLLDQDNLCMCSSAKRLKSFCDPLTINETSSFVAPSMHVRTVDLSIIQHTGLRDALSQGLNHIPLRPTKIGEIIAIVMDAYSQLVDILQLTKLHFPVEEAQCYLHEQCLAILKTANQSNKFGFKYSGRFLLDLPAVKNEIAWLHNYLYCSGLDKAANNASFICIKHIRLQAFERLMGSDFQPCMAQSTWSLPTSILDKVTCELLDIFPESPPQYTSLPYLMASYKLHKTKYRWLTNAFRTVYANIALLLTITSNLVLDSVKSWAQLTEKGYKNFLQVDTSLFWIVDSVIDTTLNLPDSIYDVFVADVTRCYESIPLHGDDNLLDAVIFLITTAYKQATLQHPKTVTLLWVRLNLDGTPAVVKWATCQPASGNWISFTLDHLLKLHEWLMTSCYILLGDRVWVQRTGIPMGCNMYLLTYEIRFIQRLCRLGRHDLMAQFKFAFRYIDDLCFINSSNPREFLSPQQVRSPDNPFWIYPLNVLEIKEETMAFSQTDSTKGILINFMNVEIAVNESAPELYTFRKYDKRRALPFIYTQYIKFKSNRNVRQAYNIVISQVLPILYISNIDDAALAEIKILIQTMTNNGFNTVRLLKNIKRFLTDGTFPATRVNISKITSTLNL